MILGPKASSTGGEGGASRDFDINVSHYIQGIVCLKESGWSLRCSIESAVELFTTGKEMDSWAIGKRPHREG